MPYANVGLQSVRPRIGLQGARPLTVRWEEMRMLISTQGDRIAQGLLALGPMTEQNLDLLEDGLAESHARKRAAEKPPSAALHTLHEECFSLRKRHYEAWLAVRDLQRSLAFKGRDPLAKVVGDADESLLTIPDRLNAEENFRTLDWNEARVRLDQLHSAVARIAGFLDRLRNALAFDKLSPGEKACECILALAARIESLERTATLAVKTAKKEKRI
jgi:hypothetical protein